MATVDAWCCTVTVQHSRHTPWYIRRENAWYPSKNNLPVKLLSRRTSSVSTRSSLSSGGMTPVRLPGTINLKFAAPIQQCEKAGDVDASEKMHKKRRPNRQLLTFGALADEVTCASGVPQNSLNLQKSRETFMRLWKFHASLTRFL